MQEWNLSVSGSIYMLNKFYYVQFMSLFKECIYLYDKISISNISSELGMIPHAGNPPGPYA